VDWLIKIEIYTLFLVCQNKMDYTFDYSPIRRSERLMQIRARVITKPILSGGLCQDKFAIIQKRTGNTIKRGSASLDIETNRFIYGSHRKKCYGCSPSQKPLIGRRKKLRESSKYIIDESIYDDY
jgi:hypothetical protein